jgi:hypothetical protein
MNLLDVFHWVHGLIFGVAALFHAWYWYRGGFWVPRYVHAIALGALLAGIAISASLPRPTNPHPAVRLLAPFIFPTLGVVATYVIAICCGYVDIARTVQAQQHSESDEPRP